MTLARQARISRKLCRKATQDGREKLFRHEIASLFFVSLVEESKRDAVIEMIAAHHKSAYNDGRELGIIDLDESDDCFGIHSKDFDKWSQISTGVLEEIGVATHQVSLEEAHDNYEYALDYCDNVIRKSCYSEWRGLLMAADHYASALNEKTVGNIEKLFIKPDLKFMSGKANCIRFRL